MKRKTLLTSILAIVMSLSMIAGATFALFTSESQVNISVTSGTVNVEATIGELTLSSTVDGVTTNGVNGKWTNGGTATVTGNTVTLDKMTPGDTVSFDITVTNHSDVTVKARTLYAATGELASGLTINGFGAVQTTGVTLWKTLDVGSQAEVYPITIALDENVGNEYQGKTATIAFTVEAVQGNAQVEDPFTVSYNGTEEKFVSFDAALECYEAANANDVTIDIAKGTYYNTNVVVEQLADKNLTIRADKDATFVNATKDIPVLLVDGNSRFFDAETLTIVGLNFELNNGAYGIQLGKGKDTTYRYPHNVTIENCSFKGADNNGYPIQSSSGSSCEEITVTGCTVDGIAEFVTLYSLDLTVSNCTATNIIGFVNNQAETSDSSIPTTLVENCEATVNGNKAEYVVRVNGGNLDVTGSTLKLESKVAYATGAIVVRRHATNVNLADNNNTITATVADGVNGVATTVCEESKDLATVTIYKAYSVSYNYKNTNKAIWVEEYDENGTKTNEYALAYTTAGLIDAIKNAPVEQAPAEEVATEILLFDQTYVDDINITIAELGKSGGDVVIKAYDSNNKPTITGTVTLGLYQKQTTNVAKYEANVTFENVIFNQDKALTHSIDVQNVDSLNLINCTIIGDGEYGIGSAAGGNTGASLIKGCIFENAAMQITGNFGGPSTNEPLVIENCIFNESVVNVQGGHAVVVKGCTFNLTLTDAHDGESFYAIRMQAIPTTVDNCTFKIDSEMTKTGTAGIKGWGVFVNRNSANMTVSNVRITLTEKALEQTALNVTVKLSSGQIYIGDNVYVNDVLQTKTLV